MSLAGSVAGQGAPADVPNASAGESLTSQDVGGRPSKYDPDFCERVVTFCSDGSSLTSFAAKIGVARRTLAGWAEQHDDFAEALDIAKAAACAWWEERARKVGDGDGGPGAASMIQFALKNLAPADFSDRREVAYTGAVNHNLLTYDQAVEEARRRGLPERVLLREPDE